MSLAEARKVQLQHEIDIATKKFHKIAGEEANPYKIVEEHIKQLKKYNEVRDTALKLMESIANLRNLTIDDIAKEMKVDIDD